MAESLETGLILMATGMGTVFMLLAMLVFVIQGVSKVSRRFDRSPPAAPLPAPATPAVDTELVTVIGAAIAAFQRDANRKQ